MPFELSGVLDDDNLDRIFDVLVNEQVACSFLVSDGVSEKIFYFSIGGIRLVSQGGRRGIPVGEILMRTGTLSRGDRDRVLELGQEQEQKFGDVLLARGYATRSDVEEALRIQLEGELCDLFLWKDAEFEFREGQPPSQFYDPKFRASSITCDVPEFIGRVRERRRRWEELKSRIASDRDVFQLTEQGRDLLSQEGTKHEILSRVDGERTVREIIDATEWTSLDAYEAIWLLAEEGLIECTHSGDDTIPLSRDELLAEISKLEHARKEAMGDLILRSRLARAYEKIGENGRAASIYREISRHHRRHNDLGAALNALEEAVRCTPEDLNSRERILEIHRTRRHTELFLTEGRELAETLFKNNLLNRARNLLAELVNVAPDQPRLRKLYALALLGLGEERTALWHLKELARILELQKADPTDLREVYRRILALDGENREVKGKLSRISGAHRNMWISRGLFAAAAALLLVSGTAFLYERGARHEYSEGIDLHALLLSHQFDEARARIRAFQDEYPWSRQGRRAPEILGRINAAESEYLKDGIEIDMLRYEWFLRDSRFAEARTILETVARLDPSRHPRIEEARRELEKVRTQEKEAERLVTRAQLLSEERRYEDALRIYREVRQMYGETEPARSIHYPLVVKTIPPGARVFLNGDEVGLSPATLFYSLQAKARIRIEMPRFEPTVLDVTEVLPPEKQFLLRKETRWVFTAEGPLEGSPVRHGSTLFVAGRDRWLYAVDVSGGTLRYRVPLGIFGDTRSTVGIAGGRVIVGVNRGEVLAFDAESGRTLWRRDVGATVAADIAVDPDGDGIYVNSGAGGVISLAPEDGRIRWESGTGAAAITAPVADGERLYIGSYESARLGVFDSANGRPLGSYSARGPVTSSAVRSGEWLAFGSDDRSVYVVDRGQDRVVEELRCPDAVKARPAVDGSRVYVGSLDGSFACFDLEEKPALQWRRQLGSAILGDPVVRDDRAYVATSDGTLYCLSREDGSTLWIFPTEGKIVSRPLLDEGTVYLTSMDGRLYAIRD